ncbi:MAG TPA: hypothetical protein VFW96_26770, partial [Thermomicrobiales bacterium]|nr:hypothetical protein [Thermomicrobiales bacterium]
GQRTLIIPEGGAVDDRLEPVGRLVRVEAARLVLGYEFDLVSNTLTPRYGDNPDTGKAHPFVAYRARDEADPPVSLVAAGGPTGVLAEE